MPSMENINNKIINQKFEIYEEVIFLDVDKFDFNNHETVKKIIVLLLNAIESLEFA